MTFKHMDATEALKRHTNERSERIKKFVSDATTECTWIFYLDGDNHVADVRVTGPHVDSFAQAKTADMYQSIDEAVEKVEKQLRKHKEIVKDHLHRNRTSGNGSGTGTGTGTGTTG
ncbi:MAG: ribosome-associated translation inhibitor RaiA [Deltaproteobacteria bacterium]|nr:ribosome-associated translation inhibitor RaiA [Deltaproteobacteria bacterium]